ncbi:hypothetical protein MF672_051025 (plasmid) [Actinomadura sp. ATCC 31491]|uniref:Uncharacterized protein n=1 Tax=Actinomadura luzonensis TaxID=2805427 RepID=A0ABT0GBV8_9ACTN|nr:hypothetical protein [Actinomadura luzonensis]MCK2222087.1 hypothetical protein [Actinomadura luzonensis]
MLHNSIPAPRGAEPGHAVLTAAATWAALAPRVAANDRVRLAVNGRDYLHRDELRLTTRLPAYVAAVHVYHHDLAAWLPGDFDVAKAAAAGAADPVGLVEAETADFIALLARCGGDCISDVAPPGGRHVLVPWAVKRTYPEMRRLAEALARRYVTFDPKPAQNRHNGLITPPGSWHRRGGYRRLTTTLEHALWVCDHPNGPEVWDALLDALAPELEALELPQPGPGPDAAAGVPGDSPVTDAAAPPARADLAVDEHGQHWLPRPDGPLPRLSPRLEEIAQTGRYDSRQYGSPSEARQAVIAGAVSCGWQLGDVAAHLRAGRWPGLAGFYSRYRDEQARTKALRTDWENAAVWLLERSFGRKSHTRERRHGGVRRILVEGLWVEVKDPTTTREQQIGELRKSRAWYSALCAAVRAGRWTGKKGLTVRRVLLALLKAAQLSKSMTIAWGVRHLALLACLDETTVARTLKLLRDEPDPFVDWVAAHRGERAAVYRLIVPQAYAEAAAWRQWAPGRLGGIHPVFRVLGGSAAFVYEVLGVDPLRTFDVPGLAGLGVTAANEGLRTLAEHGLAGRTREGWVRGPADPEQVAAQLGVREIVDKIMKRYRKDREGYREWLGIVAGLEPKFDGDREDWSLPDEVYATLGVPEFMILEPHGPPHARRAVT